MAIDVTELNQEQMRTAIETKINEISETVENLHFTIHEKLRQMWYKLLSE